MKNPLVFDGGDATIHSVFFALCKNVNTPHSLAAWLCFKYDHAALVGLELQPLDYTDAKFAWLQKTPQTFAYDLLISEFLSKYKGLNIKVDTADVAIQSFKTSEQRLSSLNRKLKAMRSAQTPRLEAIISIARRKISQVLGLRSEADFGFGWGPGATFTISRDVAWDTKILEKRISVTADALPIAQIVIGADIHWCQARGIAAEGPCSLLRTEFEVVKGNRITTVPKNAKTDRCIAIEPTANIYLQKGVGSWIRRRLKRICRVDLDDQTVNQKFAQRLEYATIDLKAASDSISRELIPLLLPEEWVNLLGFLRSPAYNRGDEWFSYEKWSSMGNGYTFELESLLFYALAYAASSFISSDPHVVVYGDDILVPVACAPSVIQVLQDFGFETNLKKTHYLGLYRESCGAHFFNRVLITPVYQKERIDHVEELYHLVNRLRHLASRLGGYYYSDKTILSAWSAALGCIPAHFIRPGPLYFEDRGGVEPSNLSHSGTIHLAIEDVESLGLPVTRPGTKLLSLVFKPRKRQYDPAAGLAYVMQSSAALLTSVVAMRGRGSHVWRKRSQVVNYRSNIWL